MTGWCRGAWSRLAAGRVYCMAVVGVEALERDGMGGGSIRVEVLGNIITWDSWDWEG